MWGWADGFFPLSCPPGKSLAGRHGYTGVLGPTNFIERWVFRKGLSLLLLLLSTCPEQQVVVALGTGVPEGSLPCLSSYPASRGTGGEHEFLLWLLLLLNVQEKFLGNTFFGQRKLQQWSINCSGISEHPGREDSWSDPTLQVEQLRAQRGNSICSNELVEI